MTQAAFRFWKDGQGVEPRPPGGSQVEIWREQRSRQRGPREQRTRWVGARLRLWRPWGRGAGRADVMPHALCRR